MGLSHRQLIVVLVLVAAQASANSCLDNSGKEVPWSFTYKMPNGYKNAYVDSNTASSKSDGLSLYKTDMDDTSTPVALIRTLLALEDSSLMAEFNTTMTTDEHASANSRYLLYNDEPDQGVGSDTYGHTKGVLHVGDSGGFWIVHSTPKWPLSTSVKNFYFPDSETKFGQTFLCITLSKSEITDVATQLTYNKPNVYFSSLSAADKSAHPPLDDVLNKKWVKGSANNTVTFSGFTSFAKTGGWGGDLYGDMVAPHLESDLLVESWIRGSATGKMCNQKYTVADITDLKAGDTTWTESQDHAKWAVTLDSSDVACVGDINRMTTQRKRGGGCVCFKSSALANQLYNSITGSDQCK